MKMITVFPEYVGSELYRVTKVTDSLEFTPGRTIKKDKLQSLCDSKKWKVTVIGVK